MRQSYRQLSFAHSLEIRSSGPFLPSGLSHHGKSVARDTPMMLFWRNEWSLRLLVVLRVCTKRDQSGVGTNEAGDHQPGHGEGDKSLAAGMSALKIA